MNTARTTKLIHKSKRITIKYDNDYYSIFANSDIDEGTILFIEQVNVNINQILQATLIRDGELFKTLYPRDETNITLKVDTNKFCEGGLFMLGKTISKLNHNCIANCDYHIFTLKYKTGFTLYFAVLYAMTNIRSNEELTICYDSTLHNKNNMWNFICHCDNKNVDFISNCLNNMNQKGKYVVRDNDLVKKILSDYHKTDICVQISTTQYILNHTKYKGLNKQYSELDIGFSRENINKWIDEYFNMRNTYLINAKYIDTSSMPENEWNNKHRIAKTMLHLREIIENA